MNVNETVESEQETASATIPPPDTSGAIDTDLDLSEEQLMLEDLKNRARTLGVRFHPSIGEEKLREKIQAALDDNATQEVTGSGGQVTSGQSEAEKKKAEQLKLIRIRITCMDPMKKAYQGDWFMAGNALIGTVKRFVPFGVEWHVPKILYNMIKEKKFNQHSTTKNARNMDITVSRLVNTYAIEHLDPLTPQELKELGQRQAMAAGKSND